MRTIWNTLTLGPDGYPCARSIPTCIDTGVLECVLFPTIVFSTITKLLSLTDKKSGIEDKTSNQVTITSFDFDSNRIVEERNWKFMCNV